MTPQPQSRVWTERVAPVERTTAEARITYDRLARWYDLFEAPLERRARAAGLKLLHTRPGEHVLEVGFGTGHTLATLTHQVEPGGSVVGVDLSARMLEVSRRRLSRIRSSVSVDLIEGDARHLPLSDASVDAVIMTFTLELIATDDIPLVLKECRRVMQASGRLVIVALALAVKMHWMTRVYLAAHRRWPRLIDCRPLPLEEVLPESGFTLADSWTGTIVGLPVTAVLAIP